MRLALLDPVASKLLVVDESQVPETLQHKLNNRLRYVLLLQPIAYLALAAWTVGQKSQGRLIGPGLFVFL
jgi:hypothetical protein